jgi:D-serine deaminase-like pyridoxal phosphate-dependent protein
VGYERDEPDDNIMGRPKLERLTRIARQADAKVAVDSAYTARGISAQAVAGGAQVGILIELVMGNRAGVATPQDAVELAKIVNGLPGLTLRGLMGYPTGPKPELATLDGGSKIFTNDGFRPGASEVNHIIEYPAARTIGQNEEHGIVDVSACEKKPELGERVTVIPNHACNTTNMHDEIAGVRRGKVETIWPILARASELAFTRLSPSLVRMGGAGGVRSGLWSFGSRARRKGRGRMPRLLMAFLAPSP